MLDTEEIESTSVIMDADHVIAEQQEGSVSYFSFYILVSSQSEFIHLRPIPLLTKQPLTDRYYTLMTSYMTMSDLMLTLKGL